MLQSKKNTKGFTIIEVLIVLAIAGMIMLVVFLAVPALQRNSRNTSRRADASHLAGIVNEYAANHAGNLPTGAQLVTASSGENWSIMNDPVAANVVNSNTFGTTTAMNVNTGRTCDPATNTLSTTGSARSFAITFQVETSGGTENACVSS